MKTALSIAGSDPSGGAGIQADMKTFAAYGVYGMSVITALTAQNTLGVSDVLEVESGFFGRQLEAVLEDILPDAAKIGMMPNRELLEKAVELLQKYGVKNIVVDTVMISTSGRRLVSEDTVQLMKSTLFPMSALITPNIPEAEYLCGSKISDESDIYSAAEQLSHETGAGGVLLKGGHLPGERSIDILYSGGRIYRFEAARVDSKNTHGTGCTLSAAIACGLALGNALPESVENAKKYLTAAIESSLDLGHGIGPLNHNV